MKSKELRYELFKKYLNEKKSKKEILEILNISDKTYQRYNKQKLEELLNKTENRQ